VTPPTTTSKPWHRGSTLYGWGFLWQGVNHAPTGGSHASIGLDKLTRQIKASSKREPIHEDKVDSSKLDYSRFAESPGQQQLFFESAHPS